MSESETLDKLPEEPRDGALENGAAASGDHERVGVPPTGGREVLLVDDDHDFADSLAALLRLEGYQVEVAYGFDEALDAAARPHPPVALVDIRLGHRNGVELVRQLRSRRPDLIAVMITAYATIEATVGALQAGAYDYLCKPFHTDDLLATLERCFERQRLQAERAQALAAVHAHNRDLEALNARLTRVLSSVHDLSGAGTVTAAGQALLGIVMRDLAAVDGVFYLHEGNLLRRENATGAGYAGTIALPPALDSPLAQALARQQPVVSAGRPADVAPLATMPGAGEGAMLVLPLADGADVFGVIVVRAAAAGSFSRQDVEVAHILASFGAAVMRVARVSERLARSEERLHDIVDNSPSAISLCDLEGGSLLSNERFREWFPAGIPDAAAEAPGLDVDQPDAMSDGAVIARGHAITRELDVSTIDGAPRRLLVTRFPVLDGARRPIGVGTIGTDVTERHLAEVRLRQAQRMEAIGQLTGGVAHDFNNLLAVVLGNLRLIEEASRDRPELLELISDAVDAARSGVGLTSRLLAFGRVQPLHPEVTDIRDMVLATSRMLGRTLGEDITIRLTLAPDLWKVKIDRSQLEASLLNLAINARDAMAGGGQLGIRANNAVLSSADIRADPEARPGRYVALSVTDHGSGMSADVRQHAIQPFFTTKPAGHGSGLGLSMVYGFVRQSGGHLQIASARARGTTVTLYFPATTSAADVAGLRHAAPTPVPTGNGERVLLVEDQPRVRLLLKRQLSRLGYQVVDVADARAALACLGDAAAVDVLLTDVVLPGELNGVELCKAALARVPSLGVVLTTGYAADVLANRSGPLASASILRKPVDSGTLARSLRAALDARTRAVPRRWAAERAQSADGENM
jgi:signal transduction histidine kinase/DNA-binding response OmpR family regulator